MLKQDANVNLSHESTIDKQVAYCIFENEKTTTPTETGTKTWRELLAVLSAREIRDRKTGRMLGAYALTGTRANKNILHHSLIQLDIDTKVSKAEDGLVIKAAPSIEHVRSTLAEYEWIATSTHSHDPKQGIIKYRVTILPDRDIQPSEHKEVLESLDALLGGILDRGAWQLSQAFYLPSCPKTTEPDAFVIHNTGKPYPVDAVCKMASGSDQQSLRILPQPIAQLRKDPIESLENIARLKEALAHISPDISRPEWLPIIWSIAAHGWNCGYEIAKSWSSSGRSFDPIKFDMDWDDYDPMRADSVTANRVYLFAKNNGWPDSTHHVPGDIQNSRKFCEDHSGKLLYVHPSRKWMIWDGTRWFWCDSKQEFLAAKHTADRLLDGACIALKSDPNDPQVKSQFTHAVKTQDERRLNAMISLATSEPSISIGSMDQLDSNPMFLCARNGVLNLKTGAILSHDPAMLITRQCNATFDPNAACPMWLKFINDIFKGNTALIEYVQRAIGYSITGLVDEEVMFFMFGYGANGKSVFINTIFSVLNDYAVTTPSSMLSVKGSDSKGRATPELTKIVGARFAVANETQSGERLDEQMVKILVSRERISARQLYSDYFDFKPTHALWVRGNHKPIITGDDHGIWRRIHLIPFERTFKPGEADPQLEHKLLSERSGILNWMLEGCLKWQEQGLNPPKIITDAGNEYRKESDVLGQWLDELCEIDPIKRTDQKSVYDSYRDWCRDGNFRPMAKAQFTRKLAERGIPDGWIGSKVRAYVGISLKAGGFMTE